MCRCNIYWNGGLSLEYDGQNAKSMLQNVVFKMYQCLYRVYELEIKKMK